MFNLATAINKYTKHEAISVNLSPHEYEYPVMMMFSEDRSKAKELIYDADAIVFKEFHFIPEKMQLDMNRLKGKSLAVLLGGGGFRHEPYRKANFKFYGAIPDIKWMATSMDMLETRPDWIWIPRSIRFDELREKYDYSKGKPPLVVSSPTSKYKTRYFFLLIIKELSQRGIDFSPLVITGENNDTCLELKARGDVFFDRIAPIYGINSLEAGAFESAVVTGYSDFVADKLKESAFECPFIKISNVAEATEAIAELIGDDAYMKQKGLECCKHVSRLFSGKESANRLVEGLEL